MANNSKKNEIRKSNDQTVEVLYQKMGNRWFAFSLIDEEVFVGSISQDELEDISLEQADAPAMRDQNIVGLLKNSHWFGIACQATVSEEPRPWLDLFRQAL